MRHPPDPTDRLDIARRKLAAGLRSLGVSEDVAATADPVLSRLLGLEGGTRELDPEQLMRQITLAARMLIERRLTHGPVLIVVEDMHLADTASVDLLGDIANPLSNHALDAAVHLPSGVAAAGPCGDMGRAMTAYTEALNLAERVGEPQLLFPCYDGVGTLNLDLGNVETAEFYLAKVQGLCERAGRDPDALLILPFLC